MSASARAGTEVEAANLALSDIGQRGITSLDDNNARARAVRTNFASVRDALLEKHHWNFATGYVSPAAAVAPTGGWPGRFKYRFPLPAGCLKVRFVADSGVDDWEVLSDLADPAGSPAEVKVLATNIDAPTICITKGVNDVRLWSPAFLKAFRHDLAAAIAPLVAGSSARADSEEAKAVRLTSEAARADGRERARGQVSRQTSWLSARRIGGGRTR